MLLTSIYKFKMDEEAKIYLCNECKTYMSNDWHEISAHLGLCTGTDNIKEQQQHSNSSYYGEPQMASCDKTTFADKENAAILPDATSDVKCWSSEQTLLLIRLVESHYLEFDSQLKKNVWQKISRELSEITNKIFTATQCDSKWKGLKKIYKNIKDHNNTSGNDIKTWQFYDPIHSFLGGKPEIDPIATCSSMSGLRQRNDSETTNDSSSEKTKKRKERETEVEKRHKEKTARQDRFLDLFEKMVSHMIAEKKE